MTRIRKEVAPRTCPCSRAPGPRARYSRDPGILSLKTYATDGRCVTREVDFTVLDLRQCSRKSQKVGVGLGSSLKRKGFVNHGSPISCPG